MSAVTRVVHCQREPYDIYIGRGGPWGNPYVIGPDGDRDTVIRKYEAHLLGRPDLLDALPQLRGRTLGCWCAPLPCHGDVLRRHADGASTAPACTHLPFDDDAMPHIRELGGFGAAALRYQALGYAVLPLTRGAKRPHRMLGDSGGVHWASTDPAAAWWAWRKDPAANIGIATGQASQLLAVDLDVKHGQNGPGEFDRFLCSGWAAPADLFPLQTAPVVLTPSGGKHIWLRIPRRRIMITGSQTWPEDRLIAWALGQHWGAGDRVLVSGACPRGADAIAERIWESWGGEVERHPARWDLHGKPAGYHRNAEMAASGPDVCLAFHHNRSPGAAHAIGRARQYGVPVLVYALPQEGPYPAPFTFPVVPERPGILPGVDVKGDGGLVVAPPSMAMISGLARPDEPGGSPPVPVPYSWLGCPCQAPPAPSWIPQWLASAPSAPGGGSAALAAATDPDLDQLTRTGIPRGQRNSVLYRLACSRMRAHHGNTAAVLEDLRAVWQAGDTDGLGWGEVLVIAESARKFIGAQIVKENAAWAAWMAGQMR